MSDAIRKFERGSVHVLIATLLDPASSGPDWEECPPPSGTLRVCTGGQLLLDGGGPAAIGELLDRLRDALAREPLAKAAHGVRIFTMRAGTQVSPTRSSSTASHAMRAVLRALVPVARSRARGQRGSSPR